MGKKAKTSRKGKKAWRANISTEDIHDFFEQSTKDALSGGSLSSAPAESLFFVDKSKGTSFLHDAFAFIPFYIIGQLVKIELFSFLRTCKVYCRQLKFAMSWVFVGELIIFFHVVVNAIITVDTDMFPTLQMRLRCKRLIMVEFHNFVLRVQRRKFNWLLHFMLKELLLTSWDAEISSDHLLRNTFSEENKAPFVMRLHCKGDR